MSHKRIFNRVVFFDFTETLLDPFIHIKTILNSVSKGRGYQCFDNKSLEKIIKMPANALLNKFSIPDAVKKEVVDEVLVCLEDKLQHIPPMHGIQNMLNVLQVHNCYLGILSSNRQNNIKKWLVFHKLDIFNEVISIAFQESKTPYLQM